MPSIYKECLVNQTTEEWLADYSGQSSRRAKKSPVTPTHIRNTDSNRLLLRYLDHRTTRAGSVVLEFETLDYKRKAVHFFNVKITSKYGKKYPSGDRGQFNPPRNGKFRRFWLQVVGKPPSRWCRVHKTMRSTLSGIIFDGAVKQEIDSNGQPYLKITDLRLK